MADVVLRATLDPTGVEAGAKKIQTVLSGLQTTEQQRARTAQKVTQAEEDGLKRRRRAIAETVKLRKQASDQVIKQGQLAVSAAEKAAAQEVSAAEKAITQNAKLRQQAATQAQLAFDKKTRAAEKAAEKEARADEKAITQNAKLRQQAATQAQLAFDKKTRAAEKAAEKETQAARQSFSTQLKARRRFNAAVAREQVRANQQREREARQTAQLQQAILASVSGAGTALIGAATLGGGASLAIGAAGVYGLARGTAAIVRQAETLQLLKVRLAGVIPEGEKLADVQQRIFQTAQASGVELESSLRLYERLTRAATRFGASQEEILTVTRAVQQSIVLSGSTPNEARNVILQLSQGLASNQLGGDELRTLRESGQRLVQAIADGLDIGVGELKEAGARGELTFRTVIDAILSQADRLDQEATAVGGTLTRGYQRFANSIIGIVDSIEERLNLAGGTGQFLTRLSQIIDHLSGLDQQVAPAVEETASALDRFQTQLDLAFGSDGPSRAFLASFSDLTQEAKEEMIGYAAAAQSTATEHKTLNDGLKPLTELEKEQTVILKGLGSEQGNLYDAEQRRAAGLRPLIDLTAANAKREKDALDTKKELAKVERERNRALAENIRQLNREAQAERQQYAASEQRRVAALAETRRTQEHLALRRAEIAVIEEAIRAGLSETEVQQQLTDVRQQHNRALLDQQRASSVITQQQYEEQRAVLEVDSTYDSLQAQLQQTTRFTDGLRDSMRDLIAEFLRGDFSARSFLDTLRGLVSQAIADRLVSTLTGQPGAGGLNLAGLTGGVGRLLTPGGLAGFGGGIGLGFLGGRAFGPLGSIAGGVGGTALTGGVVSAFTGGSFSAGAAGSLGLGGSSLGAFAGPAGIAVAGAIAGKLIADLFSQPGRIQIEKESLKGFLNELFPGESFSTFSSSKVRERITGSPEEWQLAGRALGIVWAQGYDEATQGTGKRFSNQFLAELINTHSETEIEAYFQRIFEEFGGFPGIIEAAANATRTFSDEQGNMLLSLAETTEEIEEMREKLAKFGDTSNLTIRELNTFAESNGRVNEEIISYNDLIAGAILLGTQFTEGVNAEATANKLLAERFMEVANNGESLTTQQDLLATQIHNGTLTIEEALIALNKLRVSAGQTAVSLQDITVDAAQVAAAISTIEAGAIDLTTFQESLRQALGLAVTGDFTLDFEAGIRTAVGEALIRGLIESVTQLATSGFIEQFVGQVNDLITSHLAGEISLADLYTGVDTLLEQYGEDIDGLNNRLGEQAGVIQEIADRWGLVEDAATNTEDAVEGVVDATRAIAEEMERAGRSSGILQRRAQALAGLGLFSSRDASAARYVVTSAEREGLPSAAESTLPQVERNLELLRDLERQTVDSFNLWVRDINAGLQESIAELNAQHRENLEILRAEQTALNGLLQAARAFGQAAQQVRQTIDSLVSGQGSPLSPGERLTFLQRRAEVVRGQLAGASPDAAPALIGQLSNLLQQQLGVGVFDPSDPRQARLFEDILGELEALEASAKERASDVERIEAALDRLRIKEEELGQRLAHDIQTLNAEATAAIDRQRVHHEAVLRDIWAVEEQYEARRNILLEEIAAAERQTAANTAATAANTEETTDAIADQPPRQISITIQGVTLEGIERELRPGGRLYAAING